MNKSNSIEAIDKTNLTNQTKFQLDKISKNEKFFIEEINQRKWCSRKLKKYVAVFDYIDPALIIVLNAMSGGVSTISFTSIVGAPLGIASAALALFFSLTTEIVRKLLNITRNRKSMIKLLLWLKVNSIALKI